MPVPDGDSLLLHGPEPSGGGPGGAGPGRTVANQAALTRSDFHHIQQVGASIEVTPSVSARGRRRGGAAEGRCQRPPAPTLTQEKGLRAE